MSILRIFSIVFVGWGIVSAAFAPVYYKMGWPGSKELRLMAIIAILIGLIMLALSFFVKRKSE